MFEMIFLMAPANNGDGGGANPFLSFLPFILIIVIMYFLMIRPQAKKQKEKQRMLEALKKGDNVITSGGIHGKVVGFTDENKTVIVKVDENVKMKVDKSAVNVVNPVGKQ
ncbi:MAG: preprotein translocase subunit YajC [Caldithrix sp.]|nr:preprotein translocase subunit YajC [Caldithrix sp.]